MPFKNNEKQREYKRRWYKKNRDKVVAEVSERKKRLRKQVWEIKEKSSCLLCEEDTTCCLDFHHRDPDQKDMAISAMINDGYSWQLILNEIKKCDILCKNCHAKVHAAEA